MAVEFNLDMQLGFFKAEEITDSSVWVKKSHDPKYDDLHKVHKCHKILCVVRNPYDITSSLMHFFPILNQGGQINEKFSERPEIWDKMVRENAQAVEMYHR